MKAKRKLFVSLVTLILLLCCSMLFVACDDEGGTGESNPTYMVAFKVDGRNYDIVLVEEGKTVTLPTAPEKDGYTFDGWYADEACLQGYTASAVSQSIDVYAKFTANVYTITYEADGGTNPNTASTFTVEDKILLADAQKSGYLFKGWKNGDEYMTSIPKGTTENITLTAVFVKDGYIITYENVDDAYCKNPKAYAVDDETFELNPAYKEGYTFDGWYTNEEFTAEKVTEITQGSTGDLTLYAKFTLIEANIIYLNTKDVYHGYATKYSVEQSVYVFDLEKAGYTFLGWFDEYDNKVTVVDFDGFWGDDVTLTAKWQLNTYTITYEDLRGADNADNQTTFTVEDGTITFADLANCGGFTFAGWSFMNGTPVKSYTFDVSERNDDIVLTAKWNAPDNALAAFTYVADDQNRITITGVKDKTVTELTVPDYVYSIDLGAFKDCTSLKKLTVPYVGNRSNGEYGSIGYFFGAKSYLNNAVVVPLSLTEVTVTGGYGNDETMKTGAFYNCFYLKKVVIQDGVTYMGRSVFYDNFALESLTIPFVGFEKLEKDTINSFTYGTFYDIFGSSTSDTDHDKMYRTDCCYNESHSYDENHFMKKIHSSNDKLYVPKSLTDVTVLAGVVPASAFDASAVYDDTDKYYYSSPISAITLGENVSCIGEYAFQNLRNLENITALGTLTDIGYYAFYDFDNQCYIPWLKNQPDGCVYLGNAVVAYKGSVPSDGCVTIKDGTVAIADGAFTELKDLKTVKFPDSLKYIGTEMDWDSLTFKEGAFSGCSALTTITGGAVKKIGFSAFYDCSSLYDISFAENVTYVSEFAFHNTGWYNEKSTAGGVAYVGKIFYKYFEAENEENTTVIIKEGTTGIASMAFSNCGNYQTPELGCTGIVKVVIPDTVEYIGDAAFRGCTNLKEVNFPSALKQIGAGAFRECSSLSGDITIPKGVKTLPNYVFHKCGDITLRFEEGSELTTICYQALYYISDNSVVYIPDSVVYMEPEALRCGTSAIIVLETDNLTTDNIRTTNNDGYDTNANYYYAGSEQTVDKNSVVFNNMYYYSETEPVPNESGNIGDYWHYDEDGNPVAWTNETFNSAYTVIDATQGENDSEHADKLFDRDIATKWCVQFDSNNYVIFRSEEAITINGYTFMTANDNAKYEGRNPKSWKIYGSNNADCADPSYDGWTEIGSVTGDETMQNVNYTAYTFLIDGNTTAYQYYKIVFTENGGSNILQLSEISLSYT